MTRGVEFESGDKMDRVSPTCGSVGTERRANFRECGMCAGDIRQGAALEAERGALVGGAFNSA